MDDHSKPDGIQVYKRLVKYALVHWQWLLLAIVGLIIGAITQPFFAASMTPLLDGTFMNKDPETIRQMPFIILAIFLARGVSGFISRYYMTKVGRTVVKTLRNQLFDQLLHVPIRYYDNNPSGQLLAKLTYNVEQVATASTQGLTILVQDVVTVIGLLALMFYRSWELTTIILLIIPVIALIIAFVSKRFRKLSRRLQESIGDITQIADETINAQREVRIFNGKDYETVRFQQANQQNWRTHMKRAIVEQLSTPFIQLIIAAALSLIIFIATHESIINDLTPGRFMSFVMAMVLLLTPIKRLSQVNSTLQHGIAAGESIFSLLDEKRELDTGSRHIDRANGKLEFDNVSFRYTNTHTDVLKSIHLDVKAGEKIALVGKSGSGKTTLVNLIPRFYDYHTGEIRLDDTPITDIALNDLRRQFAYVGQNITLFNDSIRNNIAYGHMQTEGSSEEREEALYKAAEAAHALEFIEKLPQGFDTQIGDDGVLLSGGQRQRLAIARAILSDAPILILDEATSALDTKSERHIQSALESLLENRTTFLIAHRLSTIEKADRILVMEDGKIIESGKHKELLAKQGTYATLYKMQFHDKPAETQTTEDVQTPVQ
jgi:subfamily B ATP-binding cassette protein MsbA